MTLFPIHRPRLGLRLGPQTLSLVEVESKWRHGWGSGGLRRWRDRPVPPGLIRISATEPNVHDVAALAGELRALRQDLRDSGPEAEPVALSLPDLCARAALFEFDALPSKPAERETLLRWLLRENFHLPAVPTRLVYRVFRQKEEAGRTGSACRVLAVTILEPVLAAYEQACMEAGLLPVAVGVSSLQLFDLCRPVMQASGREEEESFFLALGEESFAFMAIRQGCPVLLRIKPWRVTEPTASVSDELVATLQFYTDSGASPSGQPSRPLFLVETTQGFARNGCPLLPPFVAEALGVHVIPIDRDGLPVLQSRSPHAQADAMPSAGLPALAGVLIR